MSQPTLKKKGFLAPFQAPSMTRPSSTDGSQFELTPAASCRTVSSLAGKTANKKRANTDSAPKKRPAGFGGTPAADPSTWDQQMLFNIDAAIDAAIGGGTAAAVSLRPTGLPAASQVDSDGETGADGKSSAEGGDAAAEPALPTGSVLAADRPATQVTPPDAAVTCLTSPPAVLKRPSREASTPEPCRPAGAVAAKRRLYSCTKGGRRSSEATDARRGRDAGRPDQKARILALQRRRTCGTWVQCCHIDCGKWRYLSAVQDPSELPQVWHCTMNDDAVYGWCSAPQQHIPNSSFPLLVLVRFTIGSLVWAHLDGFPWWPAVVDDDPDVEEFFWLDGFSDAPTHYHVTFLDGPSQPPTRAWVGTSQVKKFQSGDDVHTRGKSSSRGVQYRSRLEAAVRMAREALPCSLEERRRRFTFVARYGGPWPVFSDSDCETARPATARRLARKKRRDRPSKRTSGAGSKVRAAPGRSRNRSRSSSRSRSQSKGRTRSTSSSSSDASRDGEAVNSLMDVVDDIVQQLTQSQSQSQSQSHRHLGDCAEAMFSDTSRSPSDSEAGGEAGATKARRRPQRSRPTASDRADTEAGGEANTSAPECDTAATAPAAGGEATTTADNPSTPRNTPSSDGGPARPTAKPKVAHGPSLEDDGSQPTVELSTDKKNSSAAKIKTNRLAKTTTNTQAVAASASAFSKTPKKRPKEAPAAADEAGAPRPKAHRPFSAKPATKPSATPCRRPAEVETGVPPARAADQAGQQPAAGGAALLTHTIDTADCRPTPVELESGALLAPLAELESSTMLEPPATPSPREYTELQSGPQEAPRQPQLFDATTATAGDDGDGDDSDPFEADY